MTKIIDNSGFFSGTNLKTEYSSVERQQFNSRYRDHVTVTCTAESILDYSCTSYISFFYNSGPAIETITRTYKGWLETLGDIGGVSEILFIAFSLIYSVYN